MSSSPSTPDLEPLLEQVSAEVAELVRAADDLIRRTDLGVVRVVWPHQKTIGYGVGPKKMSEHYAYIAVYERHLNLGCNYGARLEDGGLLGGTGQNMRSATVRSREELADPRWPAVLSAARQERLRALGRA
jgi:hypothetical protein